MALKKEDNVGVINKYFNSEKSKINFGRLLLNFEIISLQTSAELLHV